MDDIGDIPFKERYKSLDCYRRFLAGWVREVLVAEPQDCDGWKIWIAKVNLSQTLHYYKLSLLTYYRSIILKS